MDGFIVAVDGLKWLLGTAGVSWPAPTATDPDWFGPGGSRGGVILDGVLDAPDVRWSEHITSVGELEMGSAPGPFRVHDQPIDTAPFNGRGLSTFLFSRFAIPRVIPSTSLNAACSATDTTITVVDASIFTAPCAVWIEREAVWVSSIVGNVLHVAMRGYLGTRPVAHTYDSSQGIAAIVWSDLPTIVKQRCVLWRVASDGVTAQATPIWRGTMERAPRLHADRARYELPVSAAWTGYQQLAAGDPNSTTRMRGYNTLACRVAVHAPSSTPGVLDYADNGQGLDAATSPVLPDALSAYQEMRNRTLNRISPSGITGSIDISEVGDGILANASLTGVGGSYTLRLRCGDQISEAASVEGGDPRHAQAELANIPDAMAALSPHNQSNRVAVDNVIENFPTTWSAPAGSPWTDAGGMQTAIAPVVRGAISDTEWLMLNPSATMLTPAADGTVAPYLVTGMSLLRRQPWTPVRRLNGTYTLFVPGTVDLHICARVTSDHWILALAHGMSDGSVVRSLIDGRDLDFSNTDPVINLTASRYASRDWFLDGEFEWGDVIKDVNLISGTAFAPGPGGRLRFVAIGPPVAGQPAAGSIARADLVDIPTWDTLADQIITGVKVAVDGLPNGIQVNNSDAIARFGQGRVVEAKLAGLSPTVTAITTPSGIARELMRRCVGIWSQPIASVKIPVSASRFGEVFYIGDYVDIEEWVLPDGTGTRGLGNPDALAILAAAACRGQVIGREPDYTRGDVLWLECALFPLVTGYAPCCRIASISGAVLTIAAPTYVDGSIGYAGTTNGVADFAAGYKVKLVQRDVDTVVEQAFTILSVNPGAGTITLTGSVPTSPTDWPTLASTGIVDVVFDHYGVATSAQRAWACIGSEAAPRVIDGTTDVDQVLAP